MEIQYDACSYIEIIVYLLEMRITAATVMNTKIQSMFLEEDKLTFKVRSHGNDARVSLFLSVHKMPCIQQGLPLSSVLWTFYHFRSE